MAASFDAHISKLADNIRDGKFKNIIFVTGAGISTNSGIPDYRSSSGFFEIMKKEFPVADASDIFTRFFFMKHHVSSNPVYQEQIEIIKNAIPSVTHKFCKQHNRISIRLYRRRQYPDRIFL